MRPLAHHAGEQTLAPLLLLLSGGGATLVVAIGRTRLAAARTSLARQQGSRRRPGDAGVAPSPLSAGGDRPPRTDSDPPYLGGRPRA
jgi:hypothetical protein